MISNIYFTFYIIELYNIYIHFGLIVSFIFRSRLVFLVYWVNDQIGGALGLGAGLELELLSLG